MSRLGRVARVGEEGFTLIEVIVAISITSLILVVIGFAVTDSFTNSTTTTHSIDRASLANFTSRYFAADIAGSVGTPATHTFNTFNPPCGPGKSVIDITTPSGTTISYVTVGTTPGPYSLFRRTCGAGPAVSQLLGRTTDKFTPVAACDTPTVGVCTLTISWNAGGATPFTVSGTRRAVFA